MEEGRKFIGCELNPVYYRQAARNIADAESSSSFGSLFAAMEHNSPIPEPAESNDPDQNATGGPLECPSMVAEQSGEQDAGEATTASASAVLSPALLAPGDPASVEGASGDVRGHAPPAFLSDEIDDDEDDRRRALIAIADGEAVDGSVVRDLIGIGYVHATTTRLIITEEGNAFLQSVNTGMVRLETNTVQPDSGVVLDSEHDARPIIRSGGRASTSFDDGIPEFLRRKPKAAA
jgi:hypothetical protein